MGYKEIVVDFMLYKAVTLKKYAFVDSELMNCITEQHAKDFLDNLFLHDKIHMFDSDLCPFCLLYITKNCKKCPFGKKYGNCDDDNSLYMKIIQDDEDNCISNALNYETIKEFQNRWNVEKELEKEL